MGDRKAFREIYGLYAEMIYNIALKFSKSKEDAEEITQEVFIKVYRFSGKFEGKSSVKTWLYRMAVNTSLNFIKKNRKLSSVEDVDLGNVYFYHPGLAFEYKEKAQLMFSLLDKLPEKQKTAFLLSYIEDLPRKEVATIMDLSLKAVEALLQRAKKKLKQLLERIYDEQRK